MQVESSRSREFQALRHQTEQLVGKYEERRKRADELAVEVTTLDGEVGLLTLVEGTLNVLLQQTSAANLKAIEELVTSGLQAIFDDLSLSFHFQVDTVRGQQSLTPVLASNGKVEGPILDSHGGGPAQVVALLLRVLTVHRLGLFPLVALDESLSMVSERYVANCARFLKGLCERLGMTILLVTHQPAFVVEATRAYEIAGGPSGSTLQLVTTP